MQFKCFNCHNDQASEGDCHCCGSPTSKWERIPLYSHGPGRIKVTERNRSNLPSAVECAVGMLIPLVVRCVVRMLTDFFSDCEEVHFDVAWSEPETETEEKKNV